MSNTLSGSHVLKAIGLNKREQDSSIRFSLNKYTTEKDMGYLLEVLPGIIDKLRKIEGIK